MSTKRIAVVPPRYGADVIGGAESVLRELAEALSGRGWEVEALTTCARDHYTWANDLPQGTTHERGVTVRRFPTVTSRKPPDIRALEAVIMGGGPLDIGSQQRWANSGMRTPGLFHYLLDHAEEYSALIFAPYMFWTTYACAPVHAERAVLMPCLHDEPFARLDIYRPLFTGSRDIWFLSDPEAELARQLFGPLRRSAVVGSGIPIPPQYEASAFRARHGLDGRYILYAGRREGLKGWDGLLEQLGRIWNRSELPFSLVTTGVGAVDVPPSLHGRVIDVGRLPDEEMPGAFAGADAYLQPSAMESFSRTVLEAWLAGTLVIANAASAVVSWHCRRSGAGLTYRDEAELQACLEFVAAHPGEARRLAAPGRDYVLSHYTWPAVLETVEPRLLELAACAS